MTRPPRHAAYRSLIVEDTENALSFPLHLLFPTDAPATGLQIGPYRLEAAPDAAPAQGRFPLVVISHGKTGAPLIYRGLAQHLARNGYVVAMLEHPGDNRNDPALTDTDLNLQYRPRHVCMAIEAVTRDAILGPSLTGKVAVAGHSFGGYTALAAAGGVPWTREGKRLEVEHDARIRALVLLAPATAWFMPPQALAEVDVPTLVYSGEHDAITPAWHAQVVKDGVPNPAKVLHRVVKGAGHFSFMSPFPEAMRVPGYAPATDPEGFDREAFQAVMVEEIREFLDGAL